MRFYRSLQQLSPDFHGCVATIGNFDGVHLGHQCVFSHLQEKAGAHGLPATVISFEPLPSEYFLPNPPTRIYPLRDKMRVLKSVGIDQFICIRFDARFAAMEAEDFVQGILLDQLKTRYLAVGDDFRFGRQRKGDFELLKRMGQSQGMEVLDTPTCEQDNQRISSTRIRQALEAGDIQAANKLLGHNYSLSGRIRHGDKLGRTIGFPTLNMRLPDNLALRKGIYAVKVSGLSEQPLYGAANLGKRPTVNGTDMRLETHLFDFDQTVYGQYVCIEPLAFIRPEEKFDSIDTMQQQIQQDCNQIKDLINNEI